MEYRFAKHGDQGLAIEFCPEISAAMTLQIAACADALSTSKVPGIMDIIPAFCSITLRYSPLIISDDAVRTWIIQTLHQVTAAASDPTKQIMVIPVCYQPPYSLDLERISGLVNLEVNEIIERHTRPDYLIHALGFMPGFMYLGGLDRSIAAPRLEQPRLKIRKGSVGIAGEQSGVYPLDSPGGWNIIGRTPLNLFDPDHTPAVPYHSGQWIRFRSISPAAFLDIQTTVDKGLYSFEWLEEGHP